MWISQWLENSNSGMFAANMALTEADDTEVQGRLRLLRLAVGRSQVALADLLQNGMTSQKWNNYERGRDRIPVDVAIRLCVVTGANLDYIYRGIMGSLPSDLIQKIQEVRQREAEQPTKRASARS
jgi:transcriptional regulator with XRE-family HTH domain